MADTISKAKRMINADTMTAVLKFTPQDGFKLSDELLNRIYTVIAVDETEFGTNKSFIVTMEDEEGRIVNLGAAALKKARVLGKVDAKGGDAHTGTKNIYSRSNAEEIWNASSYFHTHGMKKEQDFEIPAKMKLQYAILAEDQETGEPVYNPFLYKGYRKVVASYQKREEFPTMDDFKEELLKSVEDGRIEGLPISMTTPDLQNWVKEDVANYRHTLILSDIPDKA